MTNIRNFNFNKLDLKISNNEYWDFYLGVDETPLCLNNGLTSGDCFVVWYDFNNPSIYPNSATTASTIFSLVTWSGATNTGYTFNTIGLTGIDNGLVPYVKDPTDPTNQNLINTLTGSTLAIASADTRLIMTLISGSSDEYIYPTE